MSKIFFSNKAETCNEKAFAPYFQPLGGTEMPKAATSHIVLTEDTMRTKANVIRTPAGKTESIWDLENIVGLLRKQWII